MDVGSKHIFQSRTRQGISSSLVNLRVIVAASLACIAENQISMEPPAVLWKYKLKEKISISAGFNLLTIEFIVNLHLKHVSGP